MEAPLQKQPVERPYMRKVVGKQGPVDGPDAATATPAPSDQPKKPKKAQRKPQKPEPDASEQEPYVIDPLTVFYAYRR
jgi:hypothetical protein